MRFFTFQRRGTPTRTFQRSWLKLSNAQRLARGLPLKAPVRKAKTVIIRQMPSAGPPVTKMGMMQVTNVDTGESVGYISATFLSTGHLGFTTDVAKALEISFVIDSFATTATGLRIIMDDSDQSIDFPILGLIQGRDNSDDDIGSSSFNYLYLGGVALPGTASGSIASLMDNTYTNATAISRASETDVVRTNWSRVLNALLRNFLPLYQWSIDLNTGLITSQWVNEDGTSVTTTELFSQGTALYAGGNSSAFNEVYSSPIFKYTLTFVPFV
ncbi:uncharacterized protein LACBIDRAFT_302918 [Laccaria bicolor S238N-H82]|uniref:Predicted protein n=1 Tax=Laccaria bicolor (strain S238N-H82 / ATCC MYA-4686) TaxID=486041 RepID=B0DIL8_LACBS|nr:uncharacterized protein LACBIDRAFT_302918 [Laccaria bicolor S238N-H82]EDR05592.1 predicted protein [Laccaria bicolor S238N-H82]|eukprot:XP_001883696.1 predicted protein [Laccaria bicolor S238N-H82]